MGIDYRVLRFYDHISREDYNEYPYDFLKVTTGDYIVEKRTCVDPENAHISVHNRYNFSTYDIMYNKNRPWSLYGNMQMKNMSRMIPLLKDNVNIQKLFWYRDDCLDLRLANIEFSYTNFEHLRYEVVEENNTAYKCEDNKYLGYIKIVDNKFASEKYLLIVDFPDESNGDTGYVQVISLPGLKNIIRYKYKHTENENPLCADFPIEVDDEPMMIGTESVCIDSFAEVASYDGEYNTHTVFYRPRVRYIEDWDLPMENIVYQDEYSKDTKEFMRWVLYVDSEVSLEQLKEDRRYINVNFF